MTWKHYRLNDAWLPGGVKETDIWRKYSHKTIWKITSVIGFSSLFWFVTLSVEHTLCSFISLSFFYQITYYKCLSPVRFKGLQIITQDLKLKKWKLVFWGLIQLSCEATAVNWSLFLPGLWKLAAGHKLKRNYVNWWQFFLGIPLNGTTLVLQ